MPPPTPLNPHPLALASPAAHAVALPLSPPCAAAVLCFPFRALADQQFNQFLSATWACDSCGVGSKSTLVLEKAQKITGWKLNHGSTTWSQKWHLEASMTNSNFKTVCSSTTLTTNFQECNGLVAKYVRLVKDQGGSGHWNGRIDLEGCGTCSQPQKMTGGTKISSGSSYQHMDDFLGRVWACDNCGAGTASVMKLPETRTINGWTRERVAGGYSATTPSQRWRLEGSMTNGNFKTICPETSLNNDMQSCDGSSVNYVRLVKVAGGSGTWNNKIIFDGCSPTTEANKCSLQTLSGATVYNDSGKGRYQQFDNFLGETWACDNCAAGTWSTMKLASPKTIHGWRRQGSNNHDVTDAQVWLREGSNSPTSGFTTICSSTVLSNSWQPCTSHQVSYVRLVKDRGGSGMWNGKIQLQGC